MQTPFIIEQKDAQLIGTEANIIYDISFEHATRHCISIRMTIRNNAGQQLILKSPVWIPGSYKVRDMNAHQHAITIHDASGNTLHWKWLEKHIILIENPNQSDIVVSYDYFANDRGVRTSHVNRNHAFILPVACLMYVEGRMEEIHHVRINREHVNWKTITTALSPTDKNIVGNKTTFGALNYHILIDSPIEIGNHHCTTFEVAGSIHEIAVVSQESIDIDWIKGEIKRAVEIQHQFWGDLPYDRYVFFLLVGEGLRGGLEHLRCNVSAVEPSAFLDKTTAQGMMALLVHEFFHTWNVNRIRPIELGPFNYEQENYTRMLWLAEGWTSYYDDLLSYRSGFYSRDEYLSVLAQSHLGKLARVPGRFSMSLKDSSFLAWTKLYSMSPDQHNQFPSYYTKGGIVALLMDILIIHKSGGKHKLEHALQEMWKLYKSDGQKGFTEEDIISIIETHCNVAIKEEFDAWHNGTEELPYQAIFNYIGLEWKEQQLLTAQEWYGDYRPFHPRKSQIFFGCNVSEDHGRIFIREVEKNSPADKAGIGIDDEIIAVNGKRVNSRSMLINALQSNGCEQPAHVLAQCDGRIYETHVQLILATTYSLKIADAITHEQERLLEFWLHG
ncbi:MAG: M61 family metallopeptidase [Candidatus Kapaibacteriota bacterium]